MIARKLYFDSLFTSAHHLTPAPPQAHTPQVASAMKEHLERYVSRPPHSGVQPFHEESTCLSQLTLGSCVLQSWSRNTLDLRGNETLVPSGPASRRCFFDHTDYPSASPNCEHRVTFLRRPVVALQRPECSLKPGRFGVRNTEPSMFWFLLIETWKVRCFFLSGTSHEPDASPCGRERVLS